MTERRVVVIGAGVAGLTAAGLLAKAGHDVTVLEAHVDPGGCAATFFYKGYHFDAGATLVGGFQPGGPHALVAERLGLTWPVHPVDPAMHFHSPDGQVVRWGSERRWREERQRAFGRRAEPFWRTQAWAAAEIWRFAATLPPWPPETVGDLAGLATRFGRRPQLAALAPLLPLDVAGWMRLSGARGRLLRQFVDAQLLIAAQRPAAGAAALFGAVALDLPRAGVYHVDGGVGQIAETLVRRLGTLGGRVIYRAEATRIETALGRVRRVVTRRKGSYEADLVIANLTPWNLLGLLGEEAPDALRRRVRALPPQWGAFTLYLGVDEELVPAGFPAHHQIVVDPSRPLGEGNSVFMSVSPSWDQGRAPEGQRTITLSTHTSAERWWALRETPGGQEAYEARVDSYQQRLLDAAETLLPGLRAKSRLTLPGTPVTFERFTGRHRGYVGGFPQRSILTATSPRTPVDGLWMVGDAIFPGQSTAGVTLGALRVAQTILGEAARRRLPLSRRPVG